MHLRVAAQLAESSVKRKDVDLIERSRHLSVNAFQQLTFPVFGSGRHSPRARDQPFDVANPMR